MKFINLLLGLLLGCSLTSYSQESNGAKLVKDFYKDFYNEHIAPDKVVTKYIQYSDDYQFKKAVEGISSFRDSPDDFLKKLRKDITEDNFTISYFNSFSNEDKAKFENLEKAKRSNVYKIKLVNTIPQYILTDNGKIVSFFGFQKAGSNEYHFIVFQ